MNQGGQMISMQRGPMMSMMAMQQSGIHSNAGIAMGSRMPQHAMHQQVQVSLSYFDYSK